MEERTKDPLKGILKSLAKGVVGKSQGEEQIEVNEPTSLTYGQNRKLRVFIKRQTSLLDGC